MAERSILHLKSEKGTTLTSKVGPPFIKGPPVNHQDISSLIWNVADDVLRGLFKPHEYGDVILPFVVLRRLDCVLEPKKDEIFDLYEDLKGKLDDPTPVILNQVGRIDSDNSSPCFSVSTESHSVLEYGLGSFWSPRKRKCLALMRKSENKES